MLPKWLHNKRIAVFDLETDYIPTTEIFCNSISFITIASDGAYTITSAKAYTQFWTPYSNGSLGQSITLLNECDYICAHNLMAFDLHEVTKHYGVILTPLPLDSLIISKLVFTQDDLYSMDPTLGIDKDLYGSYSLKAFGQRLGDFKIDYNDFSHLNAEMVVYCNQDTDLAVRLLLFLLEKEELPNYEVIDLEHKAANIIYEQTVAGFYIDIDALRTLNVAFLKEKGELYRRLSETFHPKFLRDGKVKTYKKLSTVKKYLPNKHYVPLLGTKEVA